VARDYYEVLEVARDADAVAIKKAYKKAARKYHPDLNQGDPSAVEKFKEASEAYDVLSNAEKRQVYDRFGHDGLKGRGFDPNFTDLGDILGAFGDLFGGGGGGFGDLFGRQRGGRSRGPRRGADLEYPLRLEFMEAALGCTKTLEIPRKVHCDTCSGTGLKANASPKTCKTCGGAGQVTQSQGFWQVRTVCPVCRGEGRVVDPADRCTDCGGSGHKRETSELEVKIPPGSYSGLQIRHMGRGEYGDPGAPPGDLYVTLDVQQHSVFKRDGQDTYVTIPVPYPLMCLGGEICIPTVHGEEQMNVPAGSESGAVFTLRGKGVAHLRHKGHLGNHHVRVVVDVPKKLTEEQEILVRKLADIQQVGVQEKGFWQGLFDKLTS
jgi:molecular chaperone DnaJ